MQLFKTQPEATIRDMPMDGRQQSGDSNVAFGGKKNAACGGDQIAEDDPGFGHEYILFDHVSHTHVKR